MDERLIELESRYTHQQQMLQDLSDVVFSQQKALDALRAEVQFLKERLRSFEPGLVEDSSDERPPHY